MFINEFPRARYKLCIDTIRALHIRTATFPCRSRRNTDIDISAWKRKDEDN